jgi:hypothetical protein
MIKNGVGGPCIDKQGQEYYFGKGVILLPIFIESEHVKLSFKKDWPQLFVYFKQNNVFFYSWSLENIPEQQGR